jgi:hypothetical protein
LIHFEDVQAEDGEHPALCYQSYLRHCTDLD